MRLSNKKQKLTISLPGSSVFLRYRPEDNTLRIWLRPIMGCNVFEAFSRPAKLEDGVGKCGSITLMLPEKKC